MEKSLEPVRPGSKREKKRKRERERDGEVSGPQLISKPGGERQERRNSIKIQKESAKGR
jgi:hypothetical protein